MRISPIRFPSGGAAHARVWIDSPERLAYFIVDGKLFRIPITVDRHHE
jgi:hypothetical protein